MSWNKSSSYWN